MNRILRTVIPIAMGIMAKSAFASGCVVTLDISNISIGWDLTFNYQSVTVSVTKTSDPACDYGLGFSKGGAGNYTRRMVGPNGVQLNYQLYRDSNLSLLLRDAPDITSTNDAILGHFDAGVQPAQVQTYFVQVPLALATAPALKPFGFYTDTFNINAYEGTNPVLFVTPITTMPVNVGATIPKIVQLSVVNSGDSFDEARTSDTVAFGTLAPGMVAQRDLLIRTNSGYSIALSSANHGVMAPANPTLTTTVPYTFMLNAGTIDLSVDQTPIAVSGQTSLVGDRYPALIRVGDISQSMAGSYSDTISVSVTSTD